MRLLGDTNRMLAPSDVGIRLSAQVPAFLFVGYSVIDPFQILLPGARTVVAAGEYFHNFRPVPVGFHGIPGTARNDECRDEQDCRTVCVHHSNVVAGPSANPFSKSSSTPTAARGAPHFDSKNVQIVGVLSSTSVHSRHCVNWQKFRSKMNCSL